MAGTEVNASRYPVMQSAVILEQMSDDPRCGGPARHQEEILARRCPAAPEEFEVHEKIRAGCVKPRHLIDEHHHLSRLEVTHEGVALEQFSKLLEGVEPVRRGSLTPVASQCRVETLELSRLVALRDARRVKRELLIE